MKTALQSWRPHKAFQRQRNANEWEVGLGGTPLTSSEASSTSPSPHGTHPPPAVEPLAVESSSSTDVAFPRLSAAEAIESPVAQRYLQTLSASERALLDKVMHAAHALGGALDAYSVAFFARFCVHNEWDEAKTLLQVEETVRWRTTGEGASVGVDRIRAELLSGVRFLALGDGVGHTVARCNVFIPGHGFLGLTKAGDPLEVCCPGQMGVNTLDGQGLMQATTDAEVRHLAPQSRRTCSLASSRLLLPPRPHTRPQPSAPLA